MFTGLRNRSKRIYHSFFVVIILVIATIIFTQCNNRSEASKNNFSQNERIENSAGLEIDTDNKPYLLLLVASNSCECTVKKCKAAEELLKEIEDELDADIKYEVIDFAEEEEKVNDYADYFEVTYLPALLFFTSNGELEEKLESNITKEEVLNEIKNLLNKE